MAQAPQAITKLYLGQGMLFIAERDTDGDDKGFRHLGNVTQLKITNTAEVIEAKESMTGQKGIIARLTTGLKVAFSATLESFNKENLAIALRADSTDITAETSGRVETRKAYKGLMLALERGGITSVTSIKTADDVTTYTATTDYVVYGDSIFIPATSTIVDGSSVKITYKHAAQTQIEALVNAETSYAFRFEGLNTADGNKSVILDIFKVSVDPLKELSLIGDKQGEILLEGNVLLDDTKPTTGSQYYRETLL